MDRRDPLHASGDPARPRIMAGIPCHNEAAFIEEIIRKTSTYVDRVLVVDDGSTDGTADIARKAGATVLSHPVNRGYGQAIISCFEAALSSEVDILVTLDGDGQHNPAELLEVAAPIVSGEADLVIGSRFMGRANNVPRYRKFGIDVITFLYNVGDRQNITDAQSGFRAYRRDVLERLQLSDTGMGLSVETLVKARHQGYRIREVPIACTYHDSSSSLNPVRHGVGVALKVVRFRAALVRLT